ncbi:glutathione S-transferase [Hortaea werneckii]|uniref:Glutathione S-transferase n=1 Tax=Hortaea werneckii TaxID=91943 RepID=A0A3M7D0F3_HORWE|nr:glutathione S-transferase [Hortaea werneckii]RMY57744.1 hypothetical protein D0865_02970 [Hortaea werneckii]
MAPITLYFLQASRSIRTAWVLEELGLEYDVVFADRENGKAPQWLKEQAGGLGKLPALKDGNLMLYESGNITEYLCDTYDKQHKLLPPPGDPKRYAALQWVHASEATYALHGLAVLYCRWFQQDGDKAKTEQGTSVNVQKDLDYLASELQKSNGKFLLGDQITAADCMMEFSADFILARQLGTLGKTWPRVEQYIKDCQATSTWQKAQKKTGHKL